MTPSEYLLELIRPFTDSAVLVGMLAFAALLALASAAGLAGLWLGIAVLPAFSKFLVRIALARISERPMRPLGIELFGPFNDIWALLPFVLIGAAVISVNTVTESFGVLPGGVLALAFSVAIPASVGALALTQSPETAINPLALSELVLRSGWAYAAVPATFAGAAGFTIWLAQEGVPNSLLILVAVYVLSLLFSQTGAVVSHSGLRELVGAADARPSPWNRREADPDRERLQVLNHAYGLFSRGNSEGGIAHIEDFVGRSTREEAYLEEYEWFFQQALHWETVVPGLKLGQRHLTRLLDAGAHSRAIKVLSRCLHEDQRFQPLPADRERLRLLAEEAGREDLLKLL